MKVKNEFQAILRAEVDGEFAHVTLTFTTDAYLSSWESDHVINNLLVTCQMSRNDVSGQPYGIEIRYTGYQPNLAEVTLAAKVMTQIDRAMKKMDVDAGGAADYATFCYRVAKIIGLQKVIHFPLDYPRLTIRERATRAVSGIGDLEYMVRAHVRHCQERLNPEIAAAA